MATGRLMSWASCGAVALWLLAGCGGGIAQAPSPAVAPAARPAEITDVLVAGSGDDVQITVFTSAKAPYSLVRQTTPPRLNLQLTGTTLPGPERAIPVNRGVVTSIKASSVGSNGSVEIFLSGEARYDIEGRGTSVVLNVSPKPVAAPEAAAAVESAAMVEEAAPVAPQAVIAVEEPASAAPAAPVVAPAPRVMVPSGPPVLMGIEVMQEADGLVATLQGNGPLKHDYFIVEGKSLVVDIAGATNTVRPMKRKLDDPWVAQIRIGEHNQPKKYVRVVFDMKKIGEHRVENFDDRIVVSFGAPALAPAGAPVAAAKMGGAAALNAVGPVTCRPYDAGTRLEISTATKPEFTLVDSGDPARVIVEIARATIAEKDARTLDLASQNLDVVKVIAFPFEKGNERFVRVVAQLRQPVSFRASADDQRVVVDFQKTAAQADASAAVPVPVPALVSLSAPAPAPVASPYSSTNSGYTGRRLSLDFKDADVNDILRLISEVSGLNFVAGVEVKGTVTIKLTDVPWDQALDLILKTNQPQLAQIRESETIIRITTADKIRDELQRQRTFEEDKKKSLDAQKALEPVSSKTFAISYIESVKMNEFVGKLEKFKSEQGKIQYDERTKHVIVIDTAEKLKEIEEVILTWDAPTPAVLVEARIVYVTSGFGQSIGVQWNANAIKDNAHGNATPYAFPNSVQIGGQQAGTGGADSMTPSGMPTNYLVNLPASAASGGVGFTLGHIANTLSLDLRLSAGETMNKVKILSNPKVLVVQNEQAVINLGSQLPIPKTDSMGNRTVEWKDVGIKLDVKPQITNDRRVFMDISIENSTQGENVQTTEGAMFSINTSRAQSKVLIADGETTVIGGIFVEETATASDSIPGLSKIPILGWLFKNKSDRQNKRELMIFITPKIVVM